MPDIQLELAVQATHNVRHIAGLDEAGRGAIAGPVFAAAVILPINQPGLLVNLQGVNDSKQLSAKNRETIFDLIVTNAVAYGIGSSSAFEIDDIGIIAANHLAMHRALNQLNPVPQFLLLDGRERLKTLNLPQKSIIRGDQTSLSIAAASILAKVSRDQALISLDKDFPVYGFKHHKGYCTRAHEDAILKHGPCPIHRHTFAPIRRPLL